MKTARQAKEMAIQEALKKQAIVTEGLISSLYEGISKALIDGEFQYIHITRDDFDWPEIKKHFKKLGYKTRCKWWGGEWTVDPAWIIKISWS